MATGLQYKNVTRLISGGYGRANGQPIAGLPCDKVEEIDGNCGVVDLNGGWQEAELVDEKEAGYSWRDSNNPSVGLNSQSSRGTVWIKDSWNAYLDESTNEFVITVKSKITRIVRDDLRGGGGSASWTRTSSASTFPQSGNRIMGEIVANIKDVPKTYDVNSQEVVHTIVLAPQQTSYENNSIYFRNWVTGSAGWDWGKENAVDSFGMGMVFKNNLPNEVSPPRFKKVDQEPRICDNVVDATICFYPPELNGYKLHLEWRYEDQDWQKNQVVETNATTGMPEVCVLVKDLVPTACEVSKVFWRAKYISNNPKYKDSDWSYGDFEVIFVPPPWMTTPDITTPECAAVGKGDLLDEYDRIVYYDGKPACKKGKC